MFFYAFKSNNFYCFFLTAALNRKAFSLAKGPISKRASQPFYLSFKKV
jgi:hypothetical protein